MIEITIQCWSPLSIVLQLNDKYQIGLDHLRQHPNVKRVTPHKMVTRTLKYVSGKQMEYTLNCDFSSHDYDTVWETKFPEHSPKKQMPVMCSIPNFTCPGQFSTHPAQNALALASRRALVSLTVLKVFSCDQAALQMVFSVCPSVRLSVCPSVCLSVCHTFLTMFPSSYHHEIFRGCYQWPK